MEKTFDPAAIESRMRELWEATGAFRAGRPERAGAEPFSIVIPPPNVTGSLHMGHALNNTLQDILARYQRMRGRDVLWQPGTDHAGIATQMVVERKLMERQQHRRELGREKFLEEVWAWKAESGGVIVEQLKRLGASCDWSRERFTLDEGLSRAVAKVFVQLHRDGLIYKDKRLVNWDPKLLTAISDLEVQQIEVKGHLWHFRYPIVYQDGQPTGDYITVATTRPETMLGDTAVAVHPEDERYQKLVGRNVRLPLVGRLIPIVADEYSDPEKGTGAVKITPAHDFNDFEVGRRHGLKLINVLDAEGCVTLEGNHDFFEHVAPSPELDMTVAALHGLDRNAARARVVAMMEERELLAEVSEHKHMVPHGDRSGAVLEPRLTDQWYVDAKTLAQPALAAVREGRTHFVPKNWEKTYFDWLENIQPWCVSRQLWWGHRIPAWYDADGNVFVEESEEEALAAARARLGRDVALTRDEDVLDTWFSSALWPFSTLGWPDETKELERFYPTNVLVTGFDIIFFWVARMMMMGLYFKKEVPFHDVYIHALVRDEKGAKMSKSKGNVIDPLHLINDYGADALRFTLAAMAAQGRDIKLATQRVEGYRNFATKLWNASRFAEINGCARVPGYDPARNEITLNRWIVSEAARAAEEIGAAIEAYRFNDAAGAAYRFVWNVFCDWYLELAKPLLQGEDGAAKDETRAAAAFTLDQIYALLHPFMPFLTEELWGVKGLEGPPRETPLALAPWPALTGLRDAAAEAEIGWVVDLVSEVRSVRSELNLAAGAEAPLVLVAAGAEVEARISVWGDTARKLARLSSIGFSDTAPKSSAQLLVRGVLAAIPLEGMIDFAAEKIRLVKETAKLEGDVKKIEAKLANADFLARAPEEVIEENRDRLDDLRARIEKLAAAAKRLG
ncbi:MULTISPECIES: valine--tRNA ligase [Methylosinus]|uniref:Valine--tRNA ligase n=1 Tax=Methylosinus trichosporium (strain ATCC 35070 / NCIMB 11131 / UNIQEM 75 / OB3b) TaxID=595536 RepID=A0A2D2CYY2_METT3|nr:MULTISPECIES: valine--tRNA ligase [Methylosinus]ATQ67946.1 valine--tRNA ligase [Methylosinus trichosporium OB3b]OBS53773.1 valine--tRNA ligase [Methylosinus sp. 3S-1]